MQVKKEWNRIAKWMPSSTYNLFLSYKTKLSMIKRLWLGFNRKQKRKKNYDMYVPSIIKQKSITYLTLSYKRFMISFLISKKKQQNLLTFKTF